MSLIVPPTLQLLLFSLVLNATVSNLKLGIIDDSRTPESRELTSTLTESKSFKLAGYYYSVDKLGDAISRGDVDAGVVIPFTYANDLQRGRPVTVQFLLNAMNANTAAIAQGYAEGVIQTYNAGLAERRPAREVHAGLGIRYQPPGRGAADRALISTIPAWSASWFVVTGIFGLLLILNGSMVASTSMVKEREAGTIEQLLMSPAGTYEIIVAKIAPLFLLLFLMVAVRDRSDQGRLRCAVSRQHLRAAERRGIVRSVRHRHRHRDRDLHAFGFPGAADQLFRQSAAHHGFGRDHAGGGHSGLAAAAGADQSDPPLQRDCALQHDQGQRNRNALAQLSGALDLHAHHGIGQRLALPETTQLDQ